MAGNKNRYSLIERLSKRRLTFRKRAKCIIKKCQELSTLCGVMVCTILTAGSSIDQVDPMAWATPPGMQSMFDLYDEQKLTGRQRKEMDHISFLYERLAKVKDKVRRQKGLNKKRKIPDMILGYLDRVNEMNRVQEICYLPSSDINDLVQEVTRILSEIDNKNKIMMNLYQLPPPSPPAAAEGGGGPAAVDWDPLMMELFPELYDGNVPLPAGSPQTNNSMGPNNP